MHIGITIPVWLCWLLGIPIGIFLLFALVVGVLFIFNPPVIFR